jgi:hypothetical protein
VTTVDHTGITEASSNTSWAGSKAETIRCYSNPNDNTALAREQGGFDVPPGRRASEGLESPSLPHEKPRR